MNLLQMDEPVKSTVCAAGDEELYGKRRKKLAFIAFCGEVMR